MSGTVYQINRKPQTPGERGIPKEPVDSVHIFVIGLEGDFNRYRTEKKASTLNQAVLIFPNETIEELKGEGWPVSPGDLGENITSQGILYNSFAVGSRYLLGDAVIEITKPCPPCRYLGVLPYVGEDKLTEFMKTLLGRRGWYARVVKEGRVTHGDKIQIVS